MAGCGVLGAVGRPVEPGRHPGGAAEAERRYGGGFLGTTRGDVEKHGLSFWPPLAASVLLVISIYITLYIFTN